MNVQITCLCGHFQEVVSLETRSAQALACHCNLCRWTTGNLFYAAVSLPGPPKSFLGLSKYNATEKVSRYFCNTCGTHIGHHVHSNNTWHMALGLVDQVLEHEQVSSCKPLLRIAQHEFVADTRDGGLALCLNGPSEDTSRFYMQAGDGEAVTSLLRKSFPAVENQVSSQTQLRAACNCGGVEFFLTRPNEESRACSSPWPDLLRPYHTYDPANPDDEKWWIRGSTKYLAGTCACRTCRLSNASPITCWAFVPAINLARKDGSVVDADMGTLRSYRSSKGRTRNFCGVCGASAFLRIDERPELWDISLGLFRAPEGARAETWFEWATDRVSFAEDAVMKNTIADLESGLKRLNQDEV